MVTSLSDIFRPQSHGVADLGEGLTGHGLCPGCAFGKDLPDIARVVFELFSFFAIRLETIYHQFCESFLGLAVAHAAAAVLVFPFRQLIGGGKQFQKRKNIALFRVFRFFDAG